jgi:ubiquinone/menaquinone biosynthesis C-methylase UbiE
VRRSFGEREGSAICMADYVHGYATPEQQRLIEQAEHWRHRLIRDGTTLEPGTRLLEVGCGVGAVLAVLGQEYQGVRLFGLDIEPQQLEFARTHLERSGVEATLTEGDALKLPFPDEAFDHVWMMWFLEHIADPPAVLREARRVLGTGGAITAIEVDYSTCTAEPSSPAMERCSGQWSRAWPHRGGATPAPGCRAGSLKQDSGTWNQGSACSRGRETTWPDRPTTPPM